jgi:hypothetical protein
LSDRRYTIIFRVVKLADAVDVDACAVVLQFVVDVYNYRITPIGFNDGTWQLSVDGKSDALYAIRGDGNIGDVEIVVNSPADFGV